MQGLLGERREGGYCDEIEKRQRRQIDGGEESSTDAMIHTYAGLPGSNRCEDIRPWLKTTFNDLIGLMSTVGEVMNILIGLYLDMTQPMVPPRLRYG